jgi:methionine synthase II (cobalamin-independent)
MNIPCNNYEENEAVCYSDGEPKGQCANCGFDETEHITNMSDKEKIIKAVEAGIKHAEFALNDYIDKWADDTTVYKRCLNTKVEQIKEMKEALAILNRLPDHEYICPKCGLRTDPEQKEADF